MCTQLTFFAAFLLNAVVAVSTGTTIVIGNKRPEGITKGPGPYFFVSEVFYGGIKKVSALTSEVTQRVNSSGFLEHIAGGLWYAHDAIWVVGGGPGLGSPNIVPSLRVYDDDTGEEILSCNIDDAVLLNDIVVLDGKAYITDSSINLLFRADVNDALHGFCNIDKIMLPKDPFLPPKNEFANNGIVPYRGGLILGTVFRNGIFYHDLRTGETYQIASGTDAPSIDGLVRRGSMLYGSETSTIAVFQLATEDGRVSATRIDTITSDSIDGVSTLATYRGTLYGANARFASLPVFANGEDDPESFTESFTLAVIRVP